MFMIQENLHQQIERMIEDCDPTIMELVLKSTVDRTVSQSPAGQEAVPLTVAEMKAAIGYLVPASPACDLEIAEADQLIAMTAT